jgi:hypothetical protein
MTLGETDPCRKPEVENLLALSLYDLGDEFET